jgi:hypothetical protein
LAASETPPAASAEEAVAAAFPAIDKLRRHLSMLMGRSDFQALLACALLLASAEVHWLTAVRGGRSWGPGARFGVICFG